MMYRINQNKIFGIDLNEYKVDRRIEERLEEKEEVLVIGADDGIYYFDGKNVKKIVPREGPVYGLAILDNKLYDAGVYKKIYRTIDNKVIRERDDEVFALTVWNNELYDAGAYGKIYRTIDNEVIAERDGSVYALTVWNNELYDAGIYKKIYRTIDNKVIGERNGTVHALTVWNNELYDAEVVTIIIIRWYDRYCNGYTYGKIYRTIDNKVIRERDDEVFALTVWNNELCDAAYGKIYRTIDDKVIVNLNQNIYSMLPVPRDILEGLI